MGIKERKQREAREKKELRRRQILASAKKLFSERDFSTVSMNEIAKDCEISKGTIYLYFSTKEELLFHLLVDNFKAQNNLISCNPENTGYEDIKTVIGYLKDAYLQDLEMKQLLAYFDFHYTKSYPDNLSIVQDFIVQIHSRLSDLSRILEKGVRDGSLRKEIDIPKTVRIINNLAASFGSRTAIRRELIIKIQGLDPKEQYFDLLDMVLKSLQNH